MQTTTALHTVISPESSLEKLVPLYMSWKILMSWTNSICVYFKIITEAAEAVNHQPTALVFHDLEMRLHLNYSSNCACVHCEQSENNQVRARYNLFNRSAESETVT